MSHNAIHAGASIIKIIIGQDNQDGVLSLLALDEHCVASKQLEGVHCVIGEGNDGVVIVGGISNTIATCQYVKLRKVDRTGIHQGIWFLLLLENGGRCIEFLGSCQCHVRLVAGRLGLDSYHSLFRAGGVAEAGCQHRQERWQV
jgi:hypothetical protein